MVRCGETCDRCWYLRIDCIWSGRTVRKLGDKFIVYGRDDVVIGEADPGFRPLPEDAEWVAKVEYAKARGLPHPYDWPEEKHAEWRAAIGRDVRCAGERQCAARATVLCATPHSKAMDRALSPLPMRLRAIWR